MTDNTEKDVLTNPEECGWTDEEIDAFIADDVLIEMKCIECGHSRLDTWKICRRKQSIRKRWRS